jgi:hypothetical protein
MTICHTLECVCGRTFQATRKGNGTMRTKCVPCDLEEVSQKFGTQIIILDGSMTTPPQPEHTEDWDDGWSDCG